MNKVTLKEGDLFNPYKVFYGVFIPNCICRLTNITPSSKMIWGRLVQYAGENGECHPKQETLAGELGLSLSTVIRGLKELEDNKFIVIILPKGKDRLMHRNHQYGFLWHRSMCQNDNSAQQQNDNSAQQQNDNSNIIGSSVRGSCLKSSPDGDECAVAQSSLHDKSLSGKRKKIPLQKSLPTSSSESVKESLSKTPTSLSGHKSKKEIQPLSIPKNVQEIFDYWNEMGLQHLPSIGTKNYNDCIHKVKGLLNGTIFGTKFSMEQIKKSIMHFSLAALDREFEPANLITKKRFSKTTIGDFIYNSFRTNGDSSLFKKYLDAPKENPTREIIKDKYPQITNALKTFYRKEVVGGAKINFTQKDENCFRSGAIQLKEFIQNNIRKLNPYVVPHDSNLAEWLCEAIKADCKEDMSIVSPAWFASGTTFNRRLPAYLYRQALIDDSRGGVITGTLGDAGADDLQIFY